MENLYHKINLELENALIKENITIIPEDKVVKIKPNIGEGTFGKVYKGIYDGKDIAIKKLKLDSDANAEDIINEIKIVRLVEHPKIPKFYGVWKNSKNYFNLVFEFVKGVTIDKLISVLKDEEKIDIIIQLTEILTDIHKKNLIHRDLKPGNIMINKTNDELTAYLIDFGTSKILTHTVSQTQTQSGTIAYMAPENFCVNINSQNEGSIDISVKFDVWSLGCFICYLLGGVKPWNGKQDSVIISNISYNRKYPIPKALNNDVAEVIKNCFVYSPKDRISSEDLLVKLKDVFGYKK